MCEFWSIEKIRKLGIFSKKERRKKSLNPELFNARGNFFVRWKMKETRRTRGGGSDASPEVEPTSWWSGSNASPDVKPTPRWKWQRCVHESEFDASVEVAPEEEGMRSKKTRLLFKISENLKNPMVGWTDLPFLKMDGQIERESGRRNANKRRRAAKG